MDIIENGPPEPRWTPPRWLAVIAVALVGAVVVAGFVSLRAPSPDGPAAAGRPGTTPTPAGSATTAGPQATAPPNAPCPVDLTRPAEPAGTPVAALVVGGRNIPVGQTIERCDPAAQDGPWTVVVRRGSGVLGRGGAVVTYPVEPAAAPTRTVPVGATEAHAGAGWLVWPLGDRHARIRGDLTEADLVRIAVATTVAAGRPAVTAPAGFRVVHSGPYRSPTVRETRYGTATLDEQVALGGGLVVVGLRGGGGLEDQTHVVTTVDAGLVGGRPARVFTGLIGGNATLVWEPAPGLVGFVSYSGTSWDEGATAALHRLAERTVAVDLAGWRATEPFVTDSPDHLPG